VIQQAIRFNLFHLLQAAGRAEDTGIPAKGLTGLGYEGQYFWDAEIYMLPYMLKEAENLAIYHENEEIRLTRGKPDSIMRLPSHE
jgi:trehalose/maltose hydrolase-like predicted phosphorylase